METPGGHSDMHNCGANLFLIRNLINHVCTFIKSLLSDSTVCQAENWYYTIPIKISRLTDQKRFCMTLEPRMFSHLLRGSTYNIAYYFFKISVILLNALDVRFCLMLCRNSLLNVESLPNVTRYQIPLKHFSYVSSKENDGSWLFNLLPDRKLCCMARK